MKISDLNKAMGRKPSKVTPWFDEETGQLRGTTITYSLKPKRKTSRRKPEENKDQSS